MNVTGTQQTGSSEFIFAVIVKNCNVSFTAAGVPALNSLSYYCFAIFPNFVVKVVQGSARVLNIKKTRKTRGGANIGGGGGGASNRMTFFCFQVDGPITRGAYKRGGGGQGWGKEAYNRNFTVLSKSSLC